jgi:hypothetical protein
LIAPTRSSVLVDPTLAERVDLIEFVWTGSVGIQPVLFLERHYLH